MTLNEFQRAALETAIYPEESRVIYPALGLAGEAGEVANKVKKVLRDRGGVFDYAAIEDIAKEVFDALWYAAALADDLGWTLDELAAVGLAKLRSRADRGKLQGSGDDR